MHVDACIGGFILPFIRSLNPSLPAFDLSVDGVTSISADLVALCQLKFDGTAQIRLRGQRRLDPSLQGCGGAEASVLRLGRLGGGFVRLADDARDQRGSDGSKSALMSTGGPMAAAWASLMAMGEAGFLKKTAALMETTAFLISAVKEVQGLEVIGNPAMTIFAFRSVDPKVNVLAVADQMEKRGWKMERQQLPDSVHLTVMPPHVAIRDQSRLLHVSAHPPGLPPIFATA